jgi:glutathione synthase/RimK-type ligase-like ATP-grasp enzyme
MTILFVRGVADDCMIGATIGDGGQISYSMDGNTSFDERLRVKEGVAAYVTLFGKSVRQHPFSFTERPTLVVNQISNADQNHGALERCVELCKQLDSPVVNRPENVLKTTRDAASALLQGIDGVTMPKTLRFQPVSPADVLTYAESQGFDFPFIVRVAGEHGGKSMVLVNGREDHDSLHVFPFDGRDFYLTEFIDFRDDSGFYHKHRIVVIDGEPILRHAMYDPDWKVHSDSRKFMIARESWDEDRKRMLWLNSEVLPRFIPAIGEITARFGLEYYGIDCHMEPDGNLVIFEANPCMNILYNPYPAMNHIVLAVQKRIGAMLAKYSGENLYLH